MKNLPKQTSLTFLLRMLKWYQCRAKGLMFPLIANVSVTRSCNFGCKFCYVDQNESQRKMSFVFFQRIVRELSSLGTCYLYLSGGEPLLINGIDEWISFAKEEIPFVHLVSNGYLLDEALARKLSRTGLDNVSISLDGDETIHDYYRGKKGSFERAVRAVENLKKYAPTIRPIISSMVAPWNAEGLEKLEEICKSLKVQQRLTATSYYPSVAKDSDKARDLLPKDCTHAINRIKRYVHKRQSSRILDFDPFVPMIPGYYQAAFDQTVYAHSVFDKACPVPSFYANILENGEVFPCPGVKSSLYPETSNLDFSYSCRKDSLRSIFFGDSYRQMVKSLLPCQECRKYLPSCYMRPRLHFPLINLLRYRVVPHLTHLVHSVIGR